MFGFSWSTWNPKENYFVILFRLQRLEELAEQTATQLAVIHRFMATNMDDVDEV